jgi:uncharacterized protein YndB with AHSA1/START domain
MDDKARATRVPAVEFERTLPGPVERVWEFLTDTRRLPQWFGPDSHIEPREGGRVNLMGGHIRGVVTRWVPPTQLTYTWNVFGPEDGPAAVSAYPESYLSLTLEVRGDEVLLKLRHLPILERFEKQTAMGWHTYLDILCAHVHGGKVEDRAAYSEKNAALYGVDLDKLEH